MGCRGTLAAIIDDIECAAMDAKQHQVWRYSGFAWVVLLALPTAYGAVRWEMGLGRDSDMAGVHELILVFLITLAAPMAALAFGVFAPLAIAIDHIAKGRTTRSINALLGASLSAPALVVTLLVVGWPDHFVDAFTSGHLRRAIALILALPLAGVIVGLGLRHRRATPPRVHRPPVAPLI